MLKTKKGVIGTLALSLTILFGCQGNSDNDNSFVGATHPDYSYYPILLDHTATAFYELPNLDFANLTEEFDFPIYIGKDEMVDEVIFGSVDDIVVSRDGWIYVLDANTRNIKVFSSTGDYVRTIGSMGEGPIEFIAPASIDILEDQLVVLDKNRTVTLIPIDSERSKKSIRWGIGFSPSAMCTMNGELFIRGFNPGEDGIGHIITVFNSDGSENRRFGPSYLSNNPLVSDVVSEGKDILCDPENNTVSTIYDILPYVITFDVDGNLLWNTKIDSFKPRYVEEIKGRNITNAINNGPIEAGMTLPIKLAKDVVSDQLIVVMVEIGSERPRMFSHLLLNAKDGSFEGAFLSDTQLLYTQSNIRVFYSHFPHPYVILEKR